MPPDPASRLRRWLRPSWAQAVLALALALVAVMAVTQIRGGARNDQYGSMSRAELIQLLDGLNAESKRLSDQIAALETTRNELQNGADAAKVAEQQAQQRLDDLGVLAGTVRAQGPGIQLLISAPAGKITPDLLLEGIVELRDSGAEAIQLNGSIRVVASSWVGLVDGQLAVDGQIVTLPLRIDVIGEPHALEEGAIFRGGFVSQLKSDRVGATVQITSADLIQIDALHTPAPPQYAKPA